MSDWNNYQGGSAHANTFGEDNWTSGGQAGNTSTNNTGFANDGFDGGDGFVGEQPAGDDKCFGCGETGHRRAECPNPQEMTCRFCKQPGHMIKECPDKPPMICENDVVKISCFNCGADGHRVRDCPEPRVDKNACKNCGQSGHRAADCEEPPNPANIECRKCNEMGHFAKDCPQGGGSRACRNCGQEGHIAKDCDQPRDMSTVTCRKLLIVVIVTDQCPGTKVQCSNCQEYGHTKVRCKVPPVDEADGFGVAGDGDGGWSNADAVGVDDGYINQNTGGNDGW